MTRRGPSIALLLVGVNIVVLLLPLAAIALYRIYDLYLLRQTERQLIAQSVVVAERYREEWWVEQGMSGDEPRPPGGEAERYVPIEPLIDIDTEIGPHEELLQLPEARSEDSPERRAGARLSGMLRRAQIFNLSGMRVLDPSGCVIATTCVMSMGSSP